MFSTVQAKEQAQARTQVATAQMATKATQQATAPQTQASSLQQEVQYRKALASMAAFTHIDFTKAGWKQFCKVNHGLGARFIRAFILKRELAAYLAAHDQVCVHLDTDCQEVHYADGVYLLLRKVQGTWYITDVILTDEPVAFAPLFFWTTIQRGVNRLLAKVLSGWHELTGQRDGKQVVQP